MNLLDLCIKLENILASFNFQYGITTILEHYIYPVSISMWHFNWSEVAYNTNVWKDSFTAHGHHLTVYIFLPSAFRLL